MWNSHWIVDLQPTSGETLRHLHPDNGLEIGQAVKQEPLPPKRFISLHLLSRRSGKNHRCSGQGPHLAMTGEPRGFSRVVAGFWSYDGDFRLRLVLGQGFNFMQSPSAVISEPPKIKSVTISTVSPSVFHEVMGQDATIFVF